MITPEMFEIVQRAGTPQCRVRLNYMAITPLAPSGHFLWLSADRFSEPIHTPEAAAWLAVQFAHDLQDLEFAWAVRDYFTRRQILPKEERYEQQRERAGHRTD